MHIGPVFWTCTCGIVGSNPCHVNILLVSCGRHFVILYYMRITIPNFKTLHTVLCINITYIYFQPHLHTC
jgi:hypothetical protein